MSEATGTSGTKTYLRLLGYVARYWFPFLIAVFGLLLHSLAEIAFIDLLRYITDTVAVLTGSAADSTAASKSGVIGGIAQGLFGDELVNESWLVIPLFLIMISAVRGVGYLIGTYFIAYVANYLVHALRTDLFNRYLLLPFKFFDQSMSGNLVSVVTFNVQQVTEAGTKAIKTVIQQGSLVILLMGYLLYVNWILTLFFIAVLPIIGMIVTKVSKRFRLISKNILSAMGDVTHVTQEAVQGYQEVRIFGAVKTERNRMSNASHDNRRQNMKMAFTGALSNPLIILIVSFAFAGVTGFMLNPIILNTMTTGSFIAFIVASGVLIKPIRQLTEVNSDIQRGIASAESIFEILDSEAEPDEGTFETEAVTGGFEFSNVSFTYKGTKKEVLKDINLKVSPGETIALVGSSGSGKTSLVSLIPRFYNHKEGQILLDGVDVNDFSLTNLRKHIGIVSQNVTLFNDTIFNNIAYGELKDRSEDRVRAAAKIANADAFIEDLSDGFDTHIGDDGVMLSGGQRQRIAIARAVLKNAPILILDEATSALDTDSERHIQAALEQLMKGRTTFVIAHRLSTVEKADRILVLEKGLIVEQGTHKELLSNKGRYAKLYRNQFDESGG
ncbi:MAG: lipid A export permease/ATP-binding protein MsbA [Porticoccaceae bacterium]|jgi:subfamily B ATP-binding cassette protein MsbA|nr:lipid A export permease/ATP-binding protein MsbA [Porticoccaceae bacterium]MBT4210636.1 lipid A export permease/ATP-binding protein MsbA [Porticoccaceae bacterium]MBT4592159.1 lipid A export permease/ATP-binding protein MsbA [Porticoccaceae bacterium]MBT5102803.1 lipid A export permease/ATP-binding protein MsbA [Porticoccaceae bacterium]MBT6422021.1 lipid A export permease/ATP-binding protein MsbA [Porticoccaceae bacterium]